MMMTDEQIAFLATSPGYQAIAAGMQDVDRELRVRTREIARLEQACRDVDAKL